MAGKIMVELSPRRDITEEEDLLQRARGRDSQAIKLIMQHHNQRLFRIARSIVRDDNEAEDVLQEAYCNAFTSLEAFRGESQISTWLARIVMNVALGRLRRRHPTMELTAMEESPGLAARIIPFPNSAPQLDPETAMAQRQVRALLERAIDDLPEAFRTILVARLVEGISTEETAELFGILPETVKTRLHRGRRLVRHAMEKHFGSLLGDAFPFAGRRCERLTDTVVERLGLN